MLKNKNIILCVTGGIAAYKTVMLASLLKKQGANVYTVMTKNAQRFVTPLTFKNITRNKVTTKMFDDSDFVPHINLANLADLIVIAPATANIISKIAYGLADDMVSTLVLASSAPKLIVPAMNTKMYQNPATVKNIKILKDYGMHVMDPDTGLLAEGTSGEGRLPEVERIYGNILKAICDKSSIFFDKKIIITAGGTVEDIDPVRCITNRSSGKMGFAFAEEFTARGARIMLMAGNVSELLLNDYIRKFTDTDIVRFRSAYDLKNEILNIKNDFDMLFMAAAVADYSISYNPEKIKKSGDILELKLSKTEDILSSIQKESSRIYTGFAAESNDIFDNARTKLKNKGLTFIIANSVTGKNSAIGGDNAEVHLLNKWNDNIDNFEYNDKKMLASLVLDRIESMIRENVPGFLK
jgi:phosphopantothenoylcysteine decarboxylase / phosphopantothenate---cysteine ligase